MPCDSYVYASSNDIFISLRKKWASSYIHLGGYEQINDKHI